MKAQELLIVVLLLVGAIFVISASSSSSIDALESQNISIGYDVERTSDLIASVIAIGATLIIFIIGISALIKSPGRKGGRR